MTDYDSDDWELENFRAIVRYCASPTVGWNPADGTIEEWVKVAPEENVRTALLGIISMAKQAMA